MSSLPYYIILDDFVLVHASLNFDLVDPFGDTEAMLWMRECNVDSARIGGRRLVSGHTAVTREQLEASLNTNRIMLDNGCVCRKAGQMESGCPEAEQHDSLVSG